MGSAVQRQEERIAILKAIADASGHDPTTMVYKKKIVQQFPDFDDAQLKAHMFYLHEKGYLEVKALQAMGRAYDFAYASITSHGIDLTEKLEDGRDVSEYGNDFSPSILINIQQGKFSQTSLFSHSVNQSIEVTHSRMGPLMDAFLQELQAKDPRPEVAAVAAVLRQEIQSKDPSRSQKITGIMQALLSMSSIAAQILTPELRALIGL